MRGLFIFQCLPRFLHLSSCRFYCTGLPFLWLDLSSVFFLGGGGGVVTVSGIDSLISFSVLSLEYTNATEFFAFIF